jgi:excisionase family DNA binding protein
MSIFISVKDAAEILGLSVRTVCRLMDHGVVPSVRLYGGRRKIPRKDFVAWLDRVLEGGHMLESKTRQHQVRRILNFTQHTPTEEQVSAGVVEPEPADKERIQSLLTFDELPTPRELRQRATECGVQASVLLKKYECDAILVGGAPFFMSVLESALRSFGVPFCYAFSKRVTQEESLADGSVRKTHVFKHAGFIFPDEEENA